MIISYKLIIDSYVNRFHCALRMLRSFYESFYIYMIHTNNFIFRIKITDYFYKNIPIEFKKLKKNAITPYLSIYSLATGKSDNYKLL